MSKYDKVIADWEALPSKQRNGRVAKQFAKRVGMKSMLEVIIAAQLEMLRQKRMLKKFEYEPEKWTYQHKPQTYTPDFRITLNDGTVDFYEAKGKMTNETRKKIVSVQRCNPDKSFKMIFERPTNKIRAGSKTTYGDWATKMGLEWSNKEVELQWLTTTK